MRRRGSCSAADARPPRALDRVRRRTRRFVPAELDPEGVILKNSISAGAALGAAIALAEVLPLEHGFWVALGALSILRSSASSTHASARQAIAGTLICFVLAALVALLVGDDTAVLWALLPVTSFVAGDSPGAVHFAAGQAAFTMFVVVLFGLLGFPDFETSVLRVETVSVGALTAVVLSLLIWPRGARVAIARTVAQVHRVADDATATFVTGGSVRRHTVEVEMSDALRLAEGAFAAAPAEHPEPLDPAAWVTVMQPAILTRVLTLGLVPAVEHASAPCAAAVVETTIHESSAVGGELRGIATSLERAEPIRPAPRRAVSDGDELRSCVESSASEGEAITNAIDLVAWTRLITHLADTLEGTRPALDAISAASAPLAWRHGVGSANSASREIGGDG